MPTSPAASSSGTIRLLATNTYAGNTNVGGPATTYVLGTSTVLGGGGAIVSGPFGTGSILQNSFNTAPRYQTIGPITLANPMTWGSGLRSRRSGKRQPHIRQPIWSFRSDAGT